MDWYMNYLNNCSQTPNEEWRQSHQSFIDSTWNNTTLLKTVEEETSIGSNVFNNIEVWKNSISEFAINTIKNAKDFRRLFFQNQTHEVLRGLKYKFNNNVWLCYEETTEEEPYQEISVRRCNNICKWVDKDTGEIIEEPCILDYETSSVNVVYTKDVATANSKVILILQGNEKTHKLIKNQRFIFSGVPYKFNAYNNYMQQDYITKDVPLLFLDCYLDQEMPSDDMINNIANRYDYTYYLSIQQDNIEQVSGFSGQLTEQVTYNNNIVNMGVVWSSSDDSIVTIDSNGNYNIIGTTVGSSVTITCAIDGNSNVYDTITITIVNSVVSEKILIVTQVTELSQYDSVTINANVYNNGEKQTDIVTCVANWADTSKIFPIGYNKDNYVKWDTNYSTNNGIISLWTEDSYLAYCTLINNGNNSWTLTNNKQSSYPLILTFTSGTLSQQLTIKLNGYM